MAHSDRRVLALIGGIVLVCVALWTLPPAPTAHALTLANGQPATLVLGQINFTSVDGGTSQTLLNGPRAIAIDPTSGKVFVADYFNHRVLRFPSLVGLQNGSAAEAVLGQPDFVSNASNCLPNALSFPASIAVDTAGRLWIAASGNHRVLRFDAAATKPNGANADGVLGQPDFITCTAATTQNGMNAPQGVALDSAGRLWVADSNNHRVLRFDAAAAKANGANADGVLGQTTFTSATFATTQNGLWFPNGIVLDSSGRLWVSELDNHRIVRFNSAATKANGANADGVLGQTTFTTHTYATTANGLYLPRGITIDGEGRLWVADTHNSRVLGFSNAATAANGANADTVLGQTTFTSASSGTSATEIAYPTSVTYDPAADVLWVADHSNHRVLMYGELTLYRLMLPLVKK